jgi:hypothetical protein
MSLMVEDDKSTTNSLIDWARNNYGCSISLRVARKYLKDDAYFWAALSEARAIHQLGTDLMKKAPAERGHSRSRKVWRATELASVRVA